MFSCVVDCIFWQNVVSENFIWKVGEVICVFCRKDRLAMQESTQRLQIRWREAETGSQKEQSIGRVRNAPKAR